MCSKCHFFRRLKKFFFWGLFALLSIPSQAEERCYGHTTQDLGPIGEGMDIVCTVGEKARIMPGFVLPVGSTLSLYGPVVAIPSGEVRVQGVLRVLGLRVLNDTGITWGGDYESGNNTTCTSNVAAPQDCHQGRDATANDDSDGHAGFSYTKLDADGNELPASATQWSCVRDNVTGLIWEVKTDDGGIHDKDNTYRWGGITAQGSGYGDYYDDWNELVNGTNAERLCGYGDWRVPTLVELESLVNFGGPVIDTAYFPNTDGSLFWSSSPYAYNSVTAWTIFFAAGYADLLPRSFTLPIRLVRSGQ